jgi:hypothetical protein
VQSNERRKPRGESVRQTGFIDFGCVLLLMGFGALCGILASLFDWSIWLVTPASLALACLLTFTIARWPVRPEKTPPDRRRVRHSGSRTGVAKDLSRDQASSQPDQ